MSVTDTALRVTYLVHAAADEIESRAEALMLEQTVELPRAVVTDSRVVSEVLGCVESIEPADLGRFRVVISQPLATAAKLARYFGMTLSKPRK